MLAGENGVKTSILLYKVKILLLCLFPIVFQSNSYSIGERAHIELGLEAIEKYILGWEEQYPPIAEFFKNEDVYPAFYAGCAFPDWGYGGINHGAGEASHWNKFISTFAKVLKEKRNDMPLPQFRKNLAFFLGIVVHSISDIPWHFDDEQNKSFLTSARELGGSSHRDSEIATDIFLFAEKELPYPISPPLYWPYDIIMEVFQRCGISATIEQLKAGCTREQGYLATGPLFAMVGYQKMKSEHKWVYEHYYDYYYGGLKHCASAVSSFMKYYFAFITGDYFIQRSLEYSPYVRKSNDYIPLSGIEDETIEGHPNPQNTDEKKYLILSNRNDGMKRALIKISLPEDFAKYAKANLWLFLAEMEYHPSQKESVKVSVFDITNSQLNERENSCDSKRTNEIDVRMTLSQMKSEEEQIFANIPLKVGWIKFDLSKYIKEWAERKVNQFSILISLMEEEDLTLRFYSSKAFMRDDGIYCGGDLIAYRPSFVMLKDTQ